MFSRALSFAPKKCSLRTSFVPKNPSPNNCVRGQTSTPKRKGILEDFGETASYFEKDYISRHKQLLEFGNPLDGYKRPFVSSFSAFVDPTSTLIGNVEIWQNTSVWPGCVIKADVNLIRIGAYTNIQDNTVIQEALQPLHDHDGSTVIGHFVTIGHSCFLKACTIEDKCIVGMGSVLEEGSYMETLSVLGAGSVLKKNNRIPSGQLWLGNPARYQRDLTPEERHWFIRDGAEYYAKVGQIYWEREQADTLNPLNLAEAERHKLV